MTVYLLLGLVGLVVIAGSLVVGDLLDGLVGGDWFSTEVVGGFVSALGFGGAAALSLGAPDLVALAVGLVAGAAFGFLGASLTRLIRGGGTDAVPAAEDLVGQEGVIVSEIPVDGFGTVRLRLGGHTLTFNARADLPLEAGSGVHVTSVLSPTAVAVAPLWSALPPLHD